MKNYRGAFASLRTKLAVWGGIGILAAVVYGAAGPISSLIKDVRVPIPDALLLKADTSAILAAKVTNSLDPHGGTEPAVVYAYLSDVSVDPAPSSAIQAHAQRIAVELRPEIQAERTGNSRTFKTSKPSVRVTEFFAGPAQYHADSAGNWRHIAYATTTVTAFNRQMGTQGANRAYAASSDFFPDPDPEITTVDGTIVGRGNTWSAARADTVGWFAVDSDASTDIGPGVWGSISGDSIIARLATGFDTSSLGPDAIISAEYTVNANLVQDDYGLPNGFINVVQPAPASDTALVASDFPNFTGLPGTMVRGSSDDKDLTFMPAGPNTWVLNATGRSWINGNGITWLGLAEGHDIENVQISLIDNTENRLELNFAESPGTDLDPKLTIVHAFEIVTVGLDVKPGSFPNSINLGSGGATPVAILGSDSLDVNDIDPDSLTLGTAGIKTVGKTDRLLCSIEDVSGDFAGGPEGTWDGFDDLVCHFITVEIIPEAGDTTVALAGELFDETPIEGSDSVNIVP